jgi:small nuclear ribonucleoprotein (snRNP)-like protein
MNLVIDDAVEVQLAMKGGKEEKRRQLGIITSSDVNDWSWLYPGQILLKGDNVSLIQALQ